MHFRAMKPVRNPTLADSICDLRSRKIKTVFFNQINTLLYWDKISRIIDNHYTKGKSATGSPSYDGLLLFKMYLLQTWYGLSDYEVEDRVYDSISFGSFCGLTIDQIVPDHSIVSRFRTAMTKAGAYEKLFKEINRQLEQHKIIVKTGAIVDAVRQTHGGPVYGSYNYAFPIPTNEINANSNMVQNKNY